MSNIEATKRLREHNSDDRLLDFFSIKLDSPLNFGKHQIFIEKAAECDAETKTRLRACGKEIQLLVQAGREKATAAARTKLQACSEDFKTFGEHEWMSQCGKTSRHNILDQHFAVKCPKLEDEGTSGDDEDGHNEFSRARDNDAPFKLWPASTWLYQVVIHDSKKDIDKEIRRRRAQKLEAAATAAAIRARQTEVSVRADAARPEVTLGDHFKRLDRRIGELDESMSLIRRTSTTTDASQKTNGNDPDPAPLQSLQRKVVQLERKVHSMQVSTPHDTSKNETMADSADTQQSAGKRRRRRKERTEDLNDVDTTSQTSQTSLAAHTQHMMTSVPQYPRPPAPTHANGNGRNANHQHHGGHPSSQRQARGPAQTHDSAPRPQDGRQWQDNVQGQPGPNHGNHGRGRGRGRGRGF